MLKNGRKPSKRLQLIEESKKRLVFHLPPIGSGGCGFALLTYVSFLLLLSVVAWQKRPHDLFDQVMVFFGAAVFWMVAALGAYIWRGLRGESKLVIVEPFRLSMEVILGRRRTSESIELGASPWSELIQSHEDEGRVDYEVRVHGESGYLDLDLSVSTEEDEWLVAEINHFLQTVDPIEAVGQPWTTPTPVLDSDLGAPPGSRIRIEQRSADRVTINIARDTSPFTDAHMTLATLVVGMPLFLGGWLIFTSQGVNASVFWIGTVMWLILLAIFLVMLRDGLACWRLEMERDRFTLQNRIWKTYLRSQQIRLLQGTRAELIVRSTINGFPYYAIALTSALRQLQFGDNLSLPEQFWLVKAMNRMLRATTALPSDPAASDLNAFELAPVDLPPGSPLFVTESTSKRLAIRIPLVKQVGIRRMGVGSVLCGTIGLLAVLAWYPSPALILAEPLLFAAALFGMGLILIGTLMQLRTDIFVSEQEFVCRRGVGPLCFEKKTVLRDTIRFVGVVQLLADEQGFQVPNHPIVRRPATYRVTCGLGSGRDQILLQIGMSYDVAAQLAALLRHRLSISGS